MVEKGRMANGNGLREGSPPCGLLRRRGRACGPPSPLLLVFVGVCGQLTRIILV